MTIARAGEDRWRAALSWHPESKGFTGVGGSRRRDSTKRRSLCPHVLAPSPMWVCLCGGRLLNRKAPAPEHSTPSDVVTTLGLDVLGPSAAVRDGSRGAEAPPQRRGARFVGRDVRNGDDRNTPAPILLAAESEDRAQRDERLRGRRAVCLYIGKRQDHPLGDVRSVWPEDEDLVGPVHASDFNVVQAPAVVEAARLARGGRHRQLHGLDFVVGEVAREDHETADVARDEVYQRLPELAVVHDQVGPHTAVERRRAFGTSPTMLRDGPNASDGRRASAIPKDEGEVQHVGVAAVSSAFVMPPRLPKDHVGRALATKHIH
mmetsp:Transcript_41975/g.115820  ORF Transcript_41975/g.115820 Transcript_41975/m.115820 type:complete len:319 (+) Transcript_41975:1660-2616(+)